MAQNVGGITINTTYVVNQNSYRQVVNNINQISRQATQMSRQFNNIGKTFGNIGKIAATAFSVKAITNFTKSAINLASDLDEVQNVVDVTFGEMAQDINEFAKTSIKAFGMSETVAKNYSSTIGAIAKSMGFATNDALTMGKTMTALAADMASFYNLKTEDAFTKIQAGLTGQVQPLKSLGINMSIANLEAYALSQGITKSVSAMTEQEKMILRNNYLLSVTKDAQGDFIRNQDSWANQTRILTEQWNTFKTTLGSIAIKFILPIIQGFNSLFATIQSTTNSLASFLGLATNSNVEISSSAGLGASAVEDIASGYEEVGKAAKKAKGQVASFDNVIQLSKPIDSGGGSGGIGGAGGNSLGVGLNTYDFTPKDEMVKGIKGQLDKIKALFKGIEKPNLDFDWGTIKENAKNTVSNILETFKNIGIFTLDIVFKVWNDIDAVGIIEGVISTFESFTGMVSKAVEAITPGLTNFYNEGIAPIVSWIGEKLKDALDVVGVELDKWGQWFSDNKDNFAELGTLLGQVVSGLWGFIEPIADVAWVVFRETVELISEAFRLFGGFILDNQNAVVGGLIAITSGILGYKAAIIGMQVVDFIKNFGLLAVQIGLLDIKTKILAVSQGALNVVMNLNPIGIIIGLIAALVAGILYLWKTNEGFRNALVFMFGMIQRVVSEFVDFIKDGFVNGFSGSLGIVGAHLDSWVGMIKGVFDGVKKIFSGIIDFIAGVFTGDWDRAFKGLKDIVLGVFKGLASIVMQPFMAVINVWNSIVGKIGTLKIPEWVPIIGGKSFNLPEIPKPKIALKDGGVVTGRTWAELGEAGPEAVVPLKNDNYTDALAQNVANRVNRGNGGREREQVINLNIYIDKNFGSDYSEIADHVEKALERKNLRMGGVNYGF